ncbi:MAG: YicC/YloC family endoribonuclease [Candidatus Gallimonas sp.]
MYSMTGFGKGEYCEDGIELTVEAKSVNNRFLDVSVKSPRVFFAYDELVRSVVRGGISRGHVDVFVSYSDRRERETSFTVDEALARSYVNAAAKIKEAFPQLPDDLTLTSVLRFPDVVKQEDRVGADDRLIEGLKRATERAMSALKEMRRKEGERLKADLLARMAAIAELRDRIAARAPSVAEEYRKKLTDRINEYLGGKADETRILTEAAVFADKCNIDEELTRLSSHVAEFYRICEQETVGRKLDFLIQEFNRECNTICSKSNDAAVTGAALEMKNEIEKVREQIQNLE